MGGNGDLRIKILSNDLARIQSDLDMRLGVSISAKSVDAPPQ